MTKKKIGQGNAMGSAVPNREISSRPGDGMSRAVRSLLLMAAICLMAGWVTPSCASAEGIDPEADRVLRSMSTYLGGLRAFSVDADIDSEHIDTNGQKLQLSSFASLVAERPGNLYLYRWGVFADMELIFNGRFLTLYSKDRNAYLQVDSPGGIDDAIETVRGDLGFDAPGADLLYADSYSGMIEGVQSSTYFGIVYVNGLECHYLAFREADVDWQLWVQAGDTPFPVKYVITTKWITGGPQYSVRFYNWNAAPVIKAGRFNFSPPEGVKKIESVQVNAVGEAMLTEEVQ